jgi:hypothetical protein
VTGKSTKIPGIRDMSAKTARQEQPMRMANCFSFISAVQMDDTLPVILMGEITIAMSASLMA